MFHLNNLTCLCRDKNGNDPIVLAPANMAGKRYTDVVSGIVKWTPALRSSYQNWSRFGPQIATCRGGIDNKVTQILVPTKYPVIKKEYTTANKCNKVGGHSTSAVDSSVFGKNIPIIFIFILNMLNIGISWIV